MAEPSFEDWFEEVRRRLAVLVARGTGPAGVEALVKFGPQQWFGAFVAGYHEHLAKERKPTEDA